jgi:hypothetical protein
VRERIAARVRLKQQTLHKRVQHERFWKASTCYAHRQPVSIQHGHCVLLVQQLESSGVLDDSAILLSLALTASGLDELNIGCTNSYQYVGSSPRGPRPDDSWCLVTRHLLVGWQHDSQLDERVDMCNFDQSSDCSIDVERAGCAKHGTCSHWCPVSSHQGEWRVSERSVL